MPDTKEDKAVLDMEADVRRMASAIRPNVANAPPAGFPGFGGKLPDARDRVTVSHLAKALDHLTGELRSAADEAWAQAQRLSGMADAANTPKAIEGNTKDRPVFEALAQQVMDCAGQLARLKSAQAAIGSALS